MSKLLVPAPVTSAEHHDLGGVYDLYGRELSHAAHMHAIHQVFAKHPALHVLVRDQHPEAADAFSSTVKGLWHIDRFDAPIEYYVAKAKAGAGVHIAQSDIDAVNFHGLDAHTQALADAAMKRDVRSYHTSEFEDEFVNLFTTQGVSALWNQAANGGAANSGASAPAILAWYNNAQAVIGVGDSSTAATNAQFDLQAATNREWVGMDASFPTLPGTGSNQIVFRATYGSALANYSWNEFAVANDNGSNVTIPGSAARAATHGSMLDRVTSTQGTKASGQTWQPSMTLSVS